MDKSTLTFGLNIGNDVTKEVYNDVKDLEKTINNILKEEYKNNNFFNHSIILKDSERINKTYPYEEHFRTIGTKYSLSFDFVKNLELNEFKNKINSKLENYLGVNQIKIIDDDNNNAYLEITISFKDWKSIKNNAHINHLIEQFSNEYSDKFFGEKIKNEYLKSFNDILTFNKLHNLDIKDQIEGYFKGYQNDIDDYLNDLEKNHLDCLNDNQYEFDI